MFSKNARIVIIGFITSLLFSSSSFAFADDFEVDQPDVVAFPSVPFTVKEYAFANYVQRTPPVEVTPNFAWPVDNNIITSSFGYRKAPCPSCSSYHEGIDFALERGTPVFAIADGLVSKVEYGTGYGQYIVIDHIVRINGVEQKMFSIYAHLKESSIAENIFPGSIVKAGELLAGVGNTGTSTGPHLHLEIRNENGEALDPETILINFATR